MAHCALLVLYFWLIFGPFLAFFRSFFRFRCPHNSWRVLFWLRSTNKLGETQQKMSKVIIIKWKQGVDWPSPAHDDVLSSILPLKVPFLSKIMIEARDNFSLQGIQWWVDTLKATNFDVWALQNIHFSKWKTCYWRCLNIFYILRGIFMHIFIIFGRFEAIFNLEDATSKCGSKFIKIPKILTLNFYS